ncbi:amidohydrolase family protein [Blastomonas fulva]|uniref:amidohydrolase family protein n=1 Tax=Blastomonas fulva TaxID=1550728 RepID=UPI0025A3F129|nr:amidohydrolase family protein [Blastomonas fulva]MDM7927290.1 amidohydrolase family protein [Blastomonas fulva]MDM7966407.1 amidohydrolase family protein [Blastomonas fulva]
MRIGRIGLTIVSALALAGSISAPLQGQALGQAQPREVADPIPPRTLGEGPWPRTVLRNAIYVDGTGAPAQGPVDIVIENDRIVRIVSIGSPGAIEEARRPPRGDKEYDLTGHYVLPGFVDAHVHLHTLSDGQGVPSDYVLKLWLAHGITTARNVGSSEMSIEQQVAIKGRLARNEITGPRLDVYPMFQQIGLPIRTAEEGRLAIRDAKRRGADGIKFIGGSEAALIAGIEEARKLGLHSTMHHAQGVVAYANVLRTSGAGLESMEHWYGLPEAMFTTQKLQDWPTDFINTDEQMRFGEAGRLWQQTARPGSDKWNEVMETLLERGFTLDPTFTAYLASRDLMRMNRAFWHNEYTMPALWDWYRPSRINHGSYWFDWTTEREMDWKENYRLWMRFVNEYKNRGGRVTVGSDAGYIYNTYGFGYIQEMELLREAGFSPLEVINSATQQGARLLGHDADIGTIEPGKKADLVIVKGNPIANLKLLFATGTLKLDDATGKAQRVGGIAWTVKDGIFYEGKALRADIRAIVARSKAERGLPPGYMTIEQEDLTQ